MAGSSAEKLLRASLWEFGVRFRTNETILGAKPSACIANCKVAIFVQDCFEDRCPVHFPKRRSVRHHKSLDAQEGRLRKAGWVVFRVWQHEVEDTPRVIAGRISMALRTVRKVLSVGA